MSPALPVPISARRPISARQRVRRVAWLTPVLLERKDQVIEACEMAGCEAQYQAIVAAPTNEMQPQRRPILRPSARVRHRGLAGEVEWPGEGPVQVRIDLLSLDPVRPQRQSCRGRRGSIDDLQVWGPAFSISPSLRREQYKATLILKVF
jgi:hypothetical protein